MRRRMLDAPVPGKRRRGRQKTRWKDLCKRDMESVELKEDVSDRNDKVEELYSLLFHQPQMVGTARGE